MSRRRKPPQPALPSRPAPNDGTPLGHLSDAELVTQFARELARRRAAAGAVDLDSIEAFATDVQRDLGGETLAAAIEALPPETTTPKPCPKCGTPTPVKARNRSRTVLTVAGELRLTRNYHHCACGTGFYPRDLELKLPHEGEVSDAMERRILDFGINDTFESVAERWSIHYPTLISSNLVRRVMDRVGLRCEAAASDESMQLACRERPLEPPSMLTVGTDGSMLLTREANWKETKVGVVARGGFIPPGEERQRRHVEDARYVAVLGSQPEFKRALAAALSAERADEVETVVWLGDGARENWTLADDLAPFAIQVLDIPHAIHWAMLCGKSLLGEGHCLLPHWEARIHQLIDADGPDEAIAELMACLPFAANDDQLTALDDVVGYYRTNDKRMRYRTFRARGLPVGSGIVESAHRHVLQVRMKRAGQRWSIQRARRMARLRAVYRTTGAIRFHAAVRAGLSYPTDITSTRRLIQPAPRRIKHTYTLHPGSSLNRALLASK
jgi:hypothetical protein